MDPSPPPAAEPATPHAAVPVGAALPATADAAAAPAARGPSRIPRRASLALVAILAASLALDVIGGGWGLPAEYSWSNDDPTPKVALAIPFYWSSDWYKYPYLQPWLDRALYQPTLWRLQRAGQLDTAKTDADCYKLDPDCLEVEDRAAVVGSFMRRSRHLRALMGVGTALAAYALARRLRAGRTAAVAAAAIVGVTQSVVFYAHVGNVDLPSTFWAAWALVAWAGLIHGDRPRDWLLLGLLGGAALATKESVVGLFVLPALVVVARRGWRAWRERRMLAGLRGIAWPGPAIAAVALLLVYGTALNVIGNPDGFRQHVAYWLTGPGIGPWNDRYQGPLWLLAQFGERLVESMGWPLVLLAGAGGALAAWHGWHAWTGALHRGRVGGGDGGDDAALPGGSGLAWLALPLTSYFLFTILPVQYTYTRFVLPVVVIAAAWGGLAFEDAWRRGPLARALVGVALLHGLLVVVHLDTLLVRDSRYAAEAWLAANVAADDTIVYVGSKTHLPRLAAVGLEGERLEEAEFTAEGLHRAGLPDVVVLSSRSVQDLDADGLRFLATTATPRGLYRPAFDAETRTGLERFMFGAELESRINPRVTVLVPKDR